MMLNVQGGTTLLTVRDIQFKLSLSFTPVNRHLALLMFTSSEFPMPITRVVFLWNGLGGGSSSGVWTSSGSSDRTNGEGHSVVDFLTGGVGGVFTFRDASSDSKRASITSLFICILSRKIL